MADKVAELLATGPMLCTAGGGLILAGILLTVLESIWPRDRAGLVLVVIRAILLIVAALTIQRPE
jgi:hypothetical protein